MTMPCMIQLNIGNEPNKYGFSIEELLKIKHEIFSFSNISLQGIMVVAPQLTDPQTLHDLFCRAANVYQELFSDIPESQLSMGMSQDFETAISAGSSMVRIGRALFKPL